MLCQITESEEQLNNLLPVERLESSPPAALLSAAKKWSELVWAKAECLGPMPLTQNEAEQGLTLATRPVFVCGVHRSGTTLAQNLLDGHPQLCVLPSEGTFYTNIEYHLNQLPATQWSHYLGTEWLRRLANPINQAPYWLLGRSTAEASPYIDFARYLLSWWQAIEQRPGTAWPHVAIVLAYASCTGGLRAKYWVDKTPANERFIERMRQEAPHARIIQVIREPLATIASRKVMEPGAAFKSALRALKASYRIAKQEAAACEPGHLLVRYEELVDEPQKVIAQLASFLSIKNLPVLEQATVAGKPAKANSSFNRGTTPGQIIKTSRYGQMDVLTNEEEKLIAAYLGHGAAALGYALPKINLLNRVWLRMKYRLLI